MNISKLQRIYLLYSNQKLKITTQIIPPPPHPNKKLTFDLIKEQPNCLQGALPPVDLQAVCLVLAISVHFRPHYLQLLNWISSNNRYSLLQLIDFLSQLNQAIFFSRKLRTEWLRHFVGETLSSILQWSLRNSYYFFTLIYSFNDSLDEIHTCW